ncbi:MAG: hypothetical protein Q9187_002200 [Circinaria calcarea]
MTCLISSKETVDSSNRSGDSGAVDKEGGLSGHFAVYGAQREPVKAEKENLNQMSTRETTVKSPTVNGGEKITISFTGHEDLENPFNWSRGKKIWVVIVGIIAVINSTWNSALPSGATEPLAKYFNISSQEQLVLPISLYLVGYASGPLLFGPLSEQIGRRATTFGPQLAPCVSGFVSVVSWRWSFWVGFIVAGLSMVGLLLLPETYGPVILKKRARMLREKTGNNNILAPIELEKTGVREILTKILARPFQMFFFEAIVLLTCLYLSLACMYNPCHKIAMALMRGIDAIFYMYFDFYPLIFQGIYSMDAGEAGVAFFPIAVGACFACGIFLYYDTILQKAQKKNTSWSSIEEYRRLPLACLGGPLIVVSLFWLGWTASPRIHWIVPMLGGIFFGVGYLLIFMALLNYLTDAYRVFAASAMAAATCCRSIFGAALPFATTPMYSKLGIAWATSLLGFLSLGMTIVPFGFIKYGPKIRANSKFCQRLEAERKKDSSQWGNCSTDVTTSPAEGSGNLEKG